MAKRITLTLLLALFGVSVVVMGLAGLQTYLSQRTELYQLGREHAVVGAKMAEYLLEKTVATGVFNLDDLFDEKLEPIPGSQPPRYHARFDRYLDRNLTPIQQAFLGTDAIYYVYTVTAGGYVTGHTDEAQAKARLDPAQYRREAEGLQLWTDSRGVTFFEFGQPIQVQGRQWGEFRVGVPLGLLHAAVRDQLLRMSLTILALALMIAAATFVLIRRSIRPLERLAEVALAIGGGDLTRPIEVSARDEVGQLAKAFSQMVTTMREMASGLHESIASLNLVVSDLSASATEQNQAISKQAAALQETQVTAQEIKQTSLLAAQKAEAVLEATTRADEVSRSGESAIEQSVNGLVEIRSQVVAMSDKIKELSGSTRQIRTITDSVKDLADQSNMLALNAAIEAVRSGEHGKGFTVVAREVRSLADQSVQSTNRVREILEDISESIAVAVSISQQGTQKMESGMSQIKSSGENLQQLSTMIRSNVAAVRQISAAVSQQNAGISQIFQAVTDQNRMMDDTVKHLQTTHATVETLKGVSERVSRIAAIYKV